MNWVYDIIEDTLIEVWEKERIRLPHEFTLNIDDAFFTPLLDGFVLASNGREVPETTKSIALLIQGHRVTVRSDADPEPWPSIDAKH